jgi:uncharacterized protein YbaR (Trm112 family)
MISPDLLQILCCPETHQTLQVADQGLISNLNSRITSGQLLNRAGKSVAKTLDGGLVRADKKYLYPIRDNIPVMLVDEAIPLESVP